MSSFKILESYLRWQNKHAVLCFFALLVSGGLLLGSSIAYPVLSQDCVALAPVAFGLFFLSAGVFNVLNILEIYLYGHMTALCIFAMVLIMIFGRANHNEHCRFIPVYSMALSFMNAAWPSLFRSFGRPPRTLKNPETSEDHSTNLPAIPQTCAPMAEVARAQGMAELPRRGQPMDPSPELLKAQRRQMDALPPPPSQSPHLDESIFRAEGSHSYPAARVSDLLLHMGPSSISSLSSGHTGSISLGSRASLPSEMSDNVRLLFQPEIDGRGPRAFPPRTTSRRAEIEALGQTYDFSREAGPKQAPLQPRARKARPS